MALLPILLIALIWAIFLTSLCALLCARAEAAQTAWKHAAGINVKAPTAPSIGEKVAA